jgi:hypothetical protein
MKAPYYAAMFEDPFAAITKFYISANSSDALSNPPKQT